MGEPLFSFFLQGLDAVAEKRVRVEKKGPKKTARPTVEASRASDYFCVRRKRQRVDCTLFIAGRKGLGSPWKKGLGSTELGGNFIKEIDHVKAMMEGASAGRMKRLQGKARRNPG